MLFVTVKEPDVEALVKSDVLTVPLTVFVVQYNVVPFSTLVVVTVKVTVEPSFTVLISGEIEYVGDLLPPPPPNPLVKADLERIGLIYILHSHFQLDNSLMLYLQNQWY
jgi:hypothetical protein